ncbi:exosome complex component RRP40-like [Argonauta hians]
MGENLSSFVDKLFLPGEIIRDLKDVDDDESKVVLGPGLRVEDKQVLVTKPGILRHKEQNTFWIDCHQRRYVPVKGDHVLGICTMKAGDVFRVDIGSNEPAGLSFLSFEGSNKRNRPDVKVGDLLYGKILIANKDMEAELVCINSQGKSAGMGVIRDGGFLFTCPLHLVRKLLNPQCLLLKSLGKNIQFEVAIGMNGRVWIKAGSTVNTIAVANAIVSAEHMTTNQIKVMCQRLSKALEAHSRENPEPEPEQTEDNPDS